MGKIVIDTAELPIGSYTIRKIGPKQFSFIPNAPSYAEVNTIEDYTYSIPANTWVSQIVIIPAEETNLTIQILGGNVLVSDIVGAGQSALFRVDLYANEADLLVAFQGIQSPTKILLIN